MNKFIKNSLKIITVFFILIILIIYYFGRYSVGSENNDGFEVGAETQYLSDITEDAKQQQQEILDFYHKQKELMDENKKLSDMVHNQEIELEEERLQIMLLKNRSKEEDEILCSKGYFQYDEHCGHAHRDYSTVEKAKEVGKQIVKETKRLEDQAKGILKKF